MSRPDASRALTEHHWRCRIGLSLLILAWGVGAIVTQSLVLREALVLMFGSEFAWGVVLFAWLFGVAVGAAIGGPLAPRIRADVGLVLVLLALSVAACVELWVFRGARAWLGVAAGELLPPTTTAFAALVFVSPVSALIGVAFPMACCVTGHAESLVGESRGRSDKPPIMRIGHVYALESAGSLIGGAWFSFWAVERLTPIETALTCLAVTAAASTCWLAVRTRRLYGPIGASVLAGAALWAGLTLGDKWSDELVQRRWRTIAPGYELCAEAESKYQNLAIGRRAEQFTLYSDGQVAVDFPDPYTFAPLAHFWMCQHPSPRRVLLLGGGAEGLLSEMLRHPVDRIHYVETDPRQAALMKPYLSDADRLALQDLRVTVHHVDPRYFVKTCAERFDLVIARLPEPMSAMRARLYTDEFYRELRRAMTEHSVLCLTAAATPGFLTVEAAEYLAAIRAKLHRHFPDITVGWGNPALILAASEPGLVTTAPAELVRRYNARGVLSDFFDPAWFDGATDWLDREKVEQRAAQLDAVQDVPISTDLRPAIYLQRLVLWERATGRHRAERNGVIERHGMIQQRGVIERLRSVKGTHVTMSLLAIGGVTLLACFVSARLRDRLVRADDTVRRTDVWLPTGAVVLAIGSTGFVTMALSIIWLFAFQNLYGYVYQRIGWIVALFMGGLVVGSGWFDARCRRIGDGDARRRYLWPRLVAVDVLLALLALAVPILLPALGALQTGPVTMRLVESCVSVLVALTGGLGGATFALAGSLQIELTGRIGAAAGAIDSADHAGACLGALFCGILLVPVFGTAAAACWLMGIKFASTGSLLLAWRRSREARAHI